MPLPSAPQLHPLYRMSHPSRAAATHPGVLSALQSNLMLFFTGAAPPFLDILADQEKSTRSGRTRRGGVCTGEEAAALMKELFSAAIGTLRPSPRRAWQAKKRYPAHSSPRIDQLYDVRGSTARWGQNTAPAAEDFLLLLRPSFRRGAAPRCSGGLCRNGFCLRRSGAHVIVNDPFIDPRRTRPARDGPFCSVIAATV